jgi:hypothetical protein
LANYSSRLTLGPGEAIFIPISHIYQDSGNYLFELNLDPNNNIIETNENNNYNTKNITIEPLPDLFLIDIDTYEDGLEVEVELEIRNEGDLEINGFDYLIDYADGNVEFIHYNETLEANSEIIITSHHNYSSYGYHQIIWELDPLNEIFEANEENNFGYSHIYIQQPHFEITNLTFFLDDSILDHSQELLNITENSSNLKIELEITSLIEETIDDLDVRIEFEQEGDEYHQIYDSINNLDSFNSTNFIFEIPVLALRNGYSELNMRIESESNEINGMDDDQLYLYFDIYYNGSNPEEITFTLDEGESEIYFSEDNESYRITNLQNGDEFLIERLDETSETIYAIETSRLDDWDYEESFVNFNNELTLRLLDEYDDIATFSLEFNEGFTNTTEITTSFYCEDWDEDNGEIYCDDYESNIDYYIFEDFRYKLYLNGNQEGQTRLSTYTHLNHEAGTYSGFEQNDNIILNENSTNMPSRSLEIQVNELSEENIELTLKSYSLDLIIDYISYVSEEETVYFDVEGDSFSIFASDVDSQEARFIVTKESTNESYDTGEIPIGGQRDLFGRELILTVLDVNYPNTEFMLIYYPIGSTIQENEIETHQINGINYTISIVNIDPIDEEWVDLLINYNGINYTTPHLFEDSYYLLNRELEIFIENLWQDGNYPYTLSASYKLRTLNEGNESSLFNIEINESWENLTGGENITVPVYLDNVAEINMEDVNVETCILNINNSSDLCSSSEPFDLPEGLNISKYFSFELPYNITQGNYDISINIIGEEYYSQNQFEEYKLFHDLVGVEGDKIKLNSQENKLFLPLSF